jgi:hypothetical protein
VDARIGWGFEGKKLKKIGIRTVNFDYYIEKIHMINMLEFRKKLDHYIKETNEIFPELKLKNMGSAGYEDEEVNSASINLLNQAVALKNKYTFSNRFIHYTSLETLFGILSEQKLRLYNCNNLNDKKELSYGINTLEIEMSNDDIEKFKKSFFVFSACEILNESIIEDYNLWRLYGREGNGVGIEFEITNPGDLWDDVFYGKVCYGSLDQNYMEMHDFIRFHQKFNSEYRIFENTPSLIPAIAMHIKDEIWKIENEIRLICYCPFDEDTYQTNIFSGGNNILKHNLHHILNKTGKITSYIDLPLNIENLRNQLTKEIEPDYIEKHIRKIPRLKIKRIILGYNNDEKVYTNLCELIDNIYKQKFNYHIDVIRSKYCQ